MSYERRDARTMAARLRLCASAALLGTLGLALACEPSHAPGGGTRDAVSSAQAALPASGTTADRPSATALGSTAPEVGASSAAANGSVASTAPPPAPLPRGLATEAGHVERIIACGGEQPLPARYTPDMVAPHCKQMEKQYDWWRTKWYEKAQPLLAKLVPAGLPTQVVYPFGGGDLVTALATFPDATEFTTISLEPSGDVRRIDALAPIALDNGLPTFRMHLSMLLGHNLSRTVDLQAEAAAQIPGEISYALVALALLGYEPVSLRYFEIERGGSLRYLDLESWGPEARKRAGQNPHETDNVELAFVKSGVAGAPVKVFRHIAHNLDNDHCPTDAPLLAHLAAKGKITAMTKAASHLLWSDQFSNIRSYLLDHMAWMISDSTGIPPRIVTAAGWVQDVYGIFTGAAPFGTTNKRDSGDLVALFKKQAPEPIAFPYGYPDFVGNLHLVVTRRP